MAVGKVFDEFADSTTAHGLNRISGSPGICLKVFWILMVLLALCLCGWQISLIVISYYSYPVEESIKIVFGELEFPTISLCNLNRFRASQKEVGGSQFVKLLDEIEKSLAPKATQSRSKRGISFGMFSEGCRSTAAGTEYTGSMSTTVSGKTCQKWASDTPHKHYYKSKDFPDKSIKKASNYCRNPSTASKGPWCYTTDPNVRWERCDVPRCHGAGFATLGDVTTTSQKVKTTTSTAEKMADEIANHNTAITDFPPIVYNSTDEDPSNSYYVPEIDLEGKPWLEDHGQPDPFVKNAELLGAALRGIPLDAQRSMGYQVESLVMECVYNGKTCTAANFTGFSNIHYGNCYTFNSGRLGPLLNAKKQGSLYGLSLTLFVDQDEYISALTPAAGVRVLLHRHDHQPFPEDGAGFDVSPGQKASVSIRMRETHRLPDPYSNCTFGEGLKLLYSGNYTVATCQRTCRQMLTNQTCGCGDPGLPIVKGLDICGETDEVCTDAVKQAFHNGDLSCDSVCPEPCRLVEYFPSVAAADWPGDSIMDSVIEKYSKRGERIAKILRRPGGVKKNLLKIEFFYDELRYEMIENDAAYGIENFLGDIGGQLGLWIGMSVLTMIEIIQLFIDLCQYCFSSPPEQSGYEDLEAGTPTADTKQ